MKTITFVAAILCLAACSAFASVAPTQCRGGVRFEPSRIGVFTGGFVYRHQIDFNGDGLMDFAGNTDTISQPVDDVGVLLRNAVGGLTLKTLTVANGTFGGFFGGRWGDFNADGRPDFLGNFSTAPFQVIFYNDGNGGLSFGAPLAFATTSEYISTFGDVNADGRPDMITTGAAFPGSDEPNYYLYLSNGNGTYAAPQLIATMHGALFFGDFDGDGRKDIAQRKDISNTQNYTIKFLLQNAAGNFVQTNEIALGRMRVEGVGEFNYDGIDDLYGTTSFSTNVAIYMSRAGQSHIVSEFPAAYKDGSYRLYFGDFNGDDAIDIVDSGRKVDATYGYTALFGNGEGGFRAFSNPAPLDDQTTDRIGQVADMNGDGLDDIVRFSTGFSTQTTVDLLTTACQSTGQTKIVDFDGDGKSDLAHWNAASGKWTVRQSSDFSTFETNWGGGALGDVPTVGDFDGDGKSDHAVYRDSTGDWYVLRSSDSSVSVVHFGLSGDKPAASDYDGDGKTDIAVFRPSEGNWYIIESRTGQFRGLHFGAPGDLPVHADYDGDSRTDVAVFRPSNGAWYFLRSSTGQYGVVAWGNATDVPVPADYDGDSKSDFAVYRASEGIWYVRRSSDGAFSTIRWGASGDQPAAFDADGDGKFEVGVYRPADRVWYLNPSTFVAFGVSGDAPVLMN